MVAAVGGAAAAAEPGSPLSPSSADAGSGSGSYRALANCVWGERPAGGVVRISVVCFLIHEASDDDDCNDDL